MTTAIPVGIAGVGHNTPERVVKNEYFTRYVETSDEWIQQRTGIRERRWIDDEQRPSDLFVEAARMAMDRGGVQPEEVDLIICGTVSGDFLLPSTACIVQDRLGCRKAAAFDIQAACPGFIYAMATGAEFIAAGKYRTVLVLGGEALSRIVDLYDRNSCVLFGDGAGAAVLKRHDDCGQGLIEDFFLGADGRGYDYIHRPRGGGRDPLNPEILAEGTHLVRIKGREVYRFAVEKMTELIHWAMDGRSLDDLGWVVPHQVNQRILATATAKLKIPEDKVMVNIDRFGNTSAASIPILLSEAWADQRLPHGKYLVLAAFGAGLTWAGARIKW